MMRLLNGNRFNRLDILVLVIIILVGVVYLPFPFGGDQAHFTLGALKMSHGKILYRDYWAWKQPGIFCFYFFAGTLFGFHEVGIHIFELLYMLIFSVTLLMTLKGYFKNSSVASLVPLLTVGIYYLVSERLTLTQVEALVSFPLFFSIWFVSESFEPKVHRVLWLYFSGFMGGLVLLFKFMFLPILAAIWLTTIIYGLTHQQEQFLKTIVRIGTPIVLGVLSPLLIVLGYFAWHDTLNILYRTFFVYPIRAVSENTLPQLTRLKDSLVWFLGKFSPLMALGFFGAYTSLSRRIDLLTLNLIAWFICGFCVILLQSQSWWIYHFLLLFVPLGILGAKGLDFLWEQIKGLYPFKSPWRRRIIAFLTLALLFSLSLGSWVKKGLLLVRHDFALKREERLKFQSRIFPFYTWVQEEVRFLSEPGSLPGDIFVFGIPIYYYLSGREQAIAHTGQWPVIFLPEQWSQLTEQLNEARPAYIFVETQFLDLIRNKSPNTARFIDENYRLLFRSHYKNKEEGTWYVLQKELQIKP